MTRSSLDGVILKLEKAKDHIETLSNETAAFLRDPSTYSVRQEQDEHRNIWLMVDRAEPPPARWGIVIGECAHNLASALDHLAFQLVVANHRRQPPKAVADRSAFPIFRSGPRFRKLNGKGTPDRGSGLAKIQGASPRVQAIIESLQPYHRRKQPDAFRLWQLYELANFDKHRLLHTTNSVMSSSTAILNCSGPLDVLGYDFFGGPMERGAAIARWRVRHVTPERKKIAVETQLVTDIQFDGRSPRSVANESVVFTLHAIATFIAHSVLPPLAAEIGSDATFNPGRVLDALTGEPLREHES